MCDLGRMPDSSRMHEFSCMPDFSWKTWLRSYAWLRSEDMTPAVYPDSGRTSWLWSYLLTLVAHHDFNWWACHMSYHLNCERLCMAGLDDCNILQFKYFVRSRLGGMHDSINIQNLSISRFRMFKCQAMCRSTDRHLAWLDVRETQVSRRTRYPCNSDGSRSSNLSGQASQGSMPRDHGTKN
jgi:hypothetical protein